VGNQRLLELSSAWGGCVSVLDTNTASCSAVSTLLDKLRIQHYGSLQYWSVTVVIHHSLVPSCTLAGLIGGHDMKSVLRDLLLNQEVASSTSMLCLSL
jgi:hypothetical protein